VSPVVRCEPRAALFNITSMRAGKGVAAGLRACNYCTNAEKRGTGGAKRASWRATTERARARDVEGSKERSRRYVSKVRISVRACWLAGGRGGVDKGGGPGCQGPLSRTPSNLSTTLAPIWCRACVHTWPCAVGSAPLLLPLFLPSLCPTTGTVSSVPRSIRRPETRLDSIPSLPIANQHRNRHPATAATSLGLSALSSGLDAGLTGVRSPYRTRSPFVQCYLRRRQTPIEAALIRWAAQGQRMR
jgi:hypothetical protein